MESYRTSGKKENSDIEFLSVIQDDRFLSSFMGQYVLRAFDAEFRSVIQYAIRDFVKYTYLQKDDPKTQGMSKEELIDFLKKTWVKDESGYPPEEQEQIHKEKEIIPVCIDLFLQKVKEIILEQK